MRFHVGPQQRVDSRLIPGPFCFEPIQDLTIQADGDRGLRFGKPEHGALEEGIPLFRDVGCIDFLVPERINCCPIRPRPFLCRALLQECLPFVRR